MQDFFVEDDKSKILSWLLLPEEALLYSSGKLLIQSWLLQKLKLDTATLGAQKNALMRL